MQRRAERIKTAIFLLLLWMMATVPVQAASADESITVSKVAAGDRISFYAAGGLENWNQTVADWMKSDEATYGRYLRQGPDIVKHMTPEEVGNLAQRMIMGLAEAGTDGFVLTRTQRVRAQKDTVTTTLPSGCYLVVVEGAQRVYTPVLFLTNQASLTVPEEMVYLPDMSKSVRRVKTAAETAADRIEAAAGDALEVTLTVSQTQYPAVFAESKKTVSICEVLDNGLELLTDSVVLTDAEGTQLQNGVDYSVQQVSDAAFYYITSAAANEAEPALAPVFYEKDGWFYLTDGSVAGNSLERALTEYNTQQDTDYREAELEMRKDGSLTVMNCNVWSQTLSLTYTMLAGNAWKPDGVWQAVSRYSYSASPIDAQALGIMNAAVEVNSYGLSTLLVDGATYDSAQPDGGPEAVYLAGGIFEVFEYAETLSGSPDKKAIQKYVQQQGGSSYRVLYREGDALADIYLLAGQFVTDENGFGGICGLTRTEHLVVQSMYPDGYALSRTGLLIQPDTDWPVKADTTVRIADTLWKNYASVELPKSGAGGIAGYTAAGLAILLTALCMLVWQTRRTFDEKQKNNHRQR